MDNNCILIKLKHALDISNTDMAEIFRLGGVELSNEEVQKMLIESKESQSDEDDGHDETEENTKCKNSELESFLNGFIIFKRGEKESKPGQPEIPALSINGNKNINNIMLKKLKIALSLSSQDMLDIFEQTKDTLTKADLSDIFRKEGHKHYKKCDDIHAMNFLEGLAKRNKK